MSTPVYPPLVLIPGFMLDETLWDEFKNYLPEVWPVRHASLNGGQTIKEIAQYIASQLPQQCVLIGFSMGGYIARQLAADYPERVAALILIASSLREDTEQQMQAKQQAIQALSPITFKGLSHSTIAKSLHPDHSNSELITRIKQMGSRLGYEALVTQSALRRAEVPTAIHCPTLVIASRYDALRTLEEADELVAALPNASLQVLDGSGHMIPLEQPEELAATIIDWLSAQPIDH
ncbi:alpha/beta fold hydrolase [Thiofilum flexile]|uniref:alpha/beta fold hydrolase n=1 Tax=Thiofilum flexile TaxID=125627 RepID=UPI00037B351A|nr:alpha/beta hydrolase [Thiofilum flexile]